MNKVNKFALIMVLMAATISFGAGYRGAAENWETWNLAYSDGVVLQFNEHNPVKVQLTDGKNFDYQALLATDNQEIKAYITGEGFDLSQVVEVNRSELRADMSGDSEVLSLFSSAGKEVEFSAAGEGSAAFVWNLGDLSYDSKRVKALIKASGDEGLLRANVGTPALGLPSDEEIVSRTLRVSIRTARRMLEERGVRLLNAVDQLKRTGTRNGLSLLSGAEPAGGGGAIVNQGGGAIDVNSMDPGSVFQVYVDSPKYKGNLQNSQLRVQLLHEATNTPLSGVGATLTVAGPIDGPNPDQIVLLDQLKFEKERGEYYYRFDPENWLIDYRVLQPGGYDLYVDFGNLQQAKLPVTVTNDRRVFYGRY